MPVIQVKLPESSVETKRALIERLTADAIEITRIPASDFFVIIHDS